MTLATFGNLWSGDGIVVLVVLILPCLVGIGFVIRAARRRRKKPPE